MAHWPKLNIFLEDHFRDSAVFCTIYWFEVYVFEFSSRSSIVSHVLLIALQVAALQGFYLSDCFNNIEECMKNQEVPRHF